MATMNASEKNRRRIVFIGIALLIVIFVVFIVLSRFGASDTSFVSDLSPITSKGVDGEIASRESSERYNSMLKTHDKEQASIASISGESYISTPAGMKAVEKNEPKDEPEIVLPPTAVENNSSYTKNKSKDPPVKTVFSKEQYERMMQAIQELGTNKILSFSSGSILYVAKAKKLEAITEQDTLPSSEMNTEREQGYFKAGDMHYSIVGTAINSDVPSPVIATIVSGKHRGTKFLGLFSRFEKKLIVKFDRAILPDGTEIKVEAYAIDPKTTEASVASKVNSHIFSRWGGLIASSFLEGLGEAKKFSGAETLDNSFDEATGQVVYNEYSTSDQAWIAAGKVGEKASTIFAQNFNRPPTVYLETGSAIGILILKSDKL